MSTFGGPEDRGVSPSEGLAIFEPVDLQRPNIASLFLAEQPAGTSGLARRLNPQAYYFAFRWNYSETPRVALQTALFRLTAANGKSILARPCDWGPNEDTGRIADLSPGAAHELGLATDDMVTVEGPVVEAPAVESPAPAAAPTATAVNAPLSPVDPQLLGLSVGPDHWMAGPNVKRMPIPGGSPLNVRRCVVEHFTNGASAASSVEAMIERQVSAHFVIDRDGSILQCRPTNLTCDHAGASHWTDPHTGILYSGANSFAIGIEYANAGDDQGVIAWARKNVPGFGSIHAVHRNGGPNSEWENFYPAQIASGLAVTKALRKRYNLDDVTGHDCISPDRKNDPGPAFPMQMIREACGFEGLPVVYKG